jgi:adenylate kinase
MTIFVAGIHAVGKTYLLKPLCEQLGFWHATASQLIKAQRGQANWTASRQVTGVEDNQRALVAAVQRLKSEGHTLVLDGHFVLRLAQHKHQAIEPDTFAQLQVQGVLLLEAPTHVVLQRLAQRGDDTWTKEEVDTFAHQEREHANAVCAQLNVPLKCLNMPDPNEAAQSLRALSQARRPNKPTILPSP